MLDSNHIASVICDIWEILVFTAHLQRYCGERHFYQDRLGGEGGGSEQRPRALGIQPAVAVAEFEAALAHCTRQACLLCQQVVSSWSANRSKVLESPTTFCNLKLSSE